MPVAHITRDVAIPKSFRTDLVSSLYDLPIEQKSHREWDVHLPIEDFDWQIGLIVGGSGTGKTTIARELWQDHYVRGYDWDERSILDHFPSSLQGREIVALLTSVGFSSPPDWIKPYGVLSTGQQMRADLARALAEATADDGSGHRKLVVFDEFTSVVDRTVARIGSAALAKAVRRRAGQQFIAVTCHEDVAEWLTPDWVYEPATDTITRRSLCPGWDKRPAIELELVRVHTEAWRLFRAHHYLSADLNIHAMCYVAKWVGASGGDVPVGLVAVLPQVGFADAFRAHRTVVLPDYQGVGIGTAISEAIAEHFVSQGKRYRSVTSHPAFIAHRRTSPLWRLVTYKAVGFARNNTGQARQIKAGSVGRTVVSFEYVGRQSAKQQAQ